MRPLFSATVAVALVAISGCAKTTDPALDRLLGLDIDAPQASTLSLTDAGTDVQAPASLRVQAVNVSVPKTLLISEANSYYPRGDIVWRGDPPGNRHDQIKAIFETAAARAAKRLPGDQAVIVDIEVERFHALTEKTRYTVGGVHSIRFKLSLRDAETGVSLGSPQTVKADLKGYGGQRALDADRQGLTQKVRITDHLASVIFAQLGGAQAQGIPVPI
ncbi:MAG: DUF6778 family protein [Pseudomonadota bacterium]